jgi:glycosyltransferase involved in cell wall biosynthesis
VAKQCALDRVDNPKLGPFEAKFVRCASVPSKLNGIAAAGRPIIAITASDGEIARLIQQHECGLVIEPGQVDALAAALINLSNDAVSLAAMGARARKMLSANYTRRISLDRWRKTLDRVGQFLT